MRGQLLQDWVTIRAQSVGNVTPITQGADAWIDVGDIEDLAFFLDVREVTGSPQMAYQTSPTKQEGSFLSMFPATTIVTGVTLTTVYSSTAPVPAARYVRWQLQSMIGNDVTFRIWLATYAWVRAG